MVIFIESQLSSYLFSRPSLFRLISEQYLVIFLHRADISAVHWKTMRQAHLLARIVQLRKNRIIRLEIEPLKPLLRENDRGNDTTPRVCSLEIKIEKEGQK